AEDKNKFELKNGSLANENGNVAIGNGVVNRAFEIEVCDIVLKPINAAEDYLKNHSKVFKYVLLGILGAGTVTNMSSQQFLMILQCLSVFFLSHRLFGKEHQSVFSTCSTVFIVIVVVLLALWLVLDTSQRPEQLISFGGVCMFILLTYLCSAHRTTVSWRPVFWGLGLQFCIGLFVIRTEPGLIAFQWLGRQVQIFLDYTKAGSSFVFGNLVNGIFAFQAMPIVVFFSSIMSVLYYLGLMQWLILKISWIMQITMGTSPTETLSVAGNIFIGQTEAPLLIRPYLKDMTKSEIHAVMTGGFATIAGSVMGAFISFGIDASSLISASVMAAPCALAFSKLSFPETEESPFKPEETVKVACGCERNILEAASSGASASITLVANIAANLIAFLAILAFINEALSWLGGMVGYPEVTFQVRSEIISTYALCGFANFSSLGVMIGGLASICPSRRTDVSVLVLRSLITATCVSLVNACIAGILFVPPFDCVKLFSESDFNGTDVNVQTCCMDLFGSAVNNGSISFEGSWSTVKNATLYLAKCCQCCGVAQEALCL
uniref:Solute carrier family 28 member 1 n=1 Tax=Hippocampus comes TaxID=109280 RepID=A0A3Q3DXN3_HIPCM